MTDPQTYSVQDNSGTVLGLVTAPRPAAALRKVCGDDLVTQDGRYGKLADGRHVAALLVPGGRRTYPDARTTRPRAR